MLRFIKKPSSFNFFLAFMLCFVFTLRGQTNTYKSKAFNAEIKHVNSDYLNINNVRATINANGRLFALENQPADDTQPGFELKDVAKHSIHAAGLWIGGKENIQNQYRLMTPTFGQTGSDIFPGPVMNLDFYQEELSKWNRVWKVTRDEIESHIANYNTPSYVVPEGILNWPAHGDLSKHQSKNLAPFVDKNFNGKYEPLKGDYPDVRGDETICYIYNDMAGSHRESGGIALGVEIIGLAYGFDREDKTYKNTVFVDYIIRNRSGSNYTDVKVGLFTDTDLGLNPYNDYAGSDPDRNTYYGYNANRNMRKEVFGKSRTPFQSVTVLTEELDGFMTYNNDWTFTGNPFKPMDFFCYLHNGWKDGKKLTNGNFGRNGSLDVKYMFDGNPLGYGGWSEKNLNNPHGDRRGLGLLEYDLLSSNAEIHISVAYSFAIGLKRMQKNVDKINKDYTYERGPFFKPGQKGDENNKLEISDALSLYPNPMEYTTELYFTNELNENFDVLITDINGRLIRKIVDLSGNRFTLNRESMQPGMYFVEIHQNQDKYINKLVVQ